MILFHFKTGLDIFTKSSIPGNSRESRNPVLCCPLNMNLLMRTVLLYCWGTLPLWFGSESNVHRHWLVMSCARRMKQITSMSLGRLSMTSVTTTNWSFTGHAWSLCGEGFCLHHKPTPCGICPWKLYLGMWWRLCTNHCLVLWLQEIHAQQLKRIWTRLSLVNVRKTISRKDSTFTRQSSVFLQGGEMCFHVIKNNTFKPILCVIRRRIAQPPQTQLMRRTVSAMKHPQICFKSRHKRPRQNSNIYFIWHRTEDVFLS